MQSFVKCIDILKMSIIQRHLIGPMMIQRKHIYLVLVGLVCLYCFSYGFNREKLENFKNAVRDLSKMNFSNTSKLDVAVHQVSNPGIIKNSTVGGTCGLEAYNAGDHQKVISYTVYGNISGYYEGLNNILGEAKLFYPGWFVRIYTDNPNSTYITKLSANHDHLHVCDVMNLPPPDKSLENYPKMMWRFWPLGDQQIDIILFRDTDSPILEREKVAVTEWLEKTNKSLHSMRDHPYHGVAILGGLWGARLNDKNRLKWRRARNKLFKRSYKNTREKGLDQYLLALEVWPFFYADALSHDSFTCRTFYTSKPFPTQRINGTYVGIPTYSNPDDIRIKVECPKQCRPKEHMDWLYC